MHEFNHGISLSPRKKVILPINATIVGKNYGGQYTTCEKLEAVN